MKVTLCNSEKVPRMEIIRAMQNSRGELRYKEIVTSFGKPKIITRY